MNDNSAPKTATSPKRQLYEKLNERDLFTKDFETFNSYYSDPKNRESLYSGLKERGLVTVDQNRFGDYYFGGRSGRGNQQDQQQSQSQQQESLPQQLTAAAFSGIEGNQENPSTTIAGTPSDQNDSQGQDLDTPPGEDVEQGEFSPEPPAPEIELASAPAESTGTQGERMINLSGAEEAEEPEEGGFRQTVEELGKGIVRGLIDLPKSVSQVYASGSINPAQTAAARRANYYLKDLRNSENIAQDEELKNEKLSTVYKEPEKLIPYLAGKVGEGVPTTLPGMGAAKLFSGAGRAAQIASAALASSPLEVGAQFEDLENTKDAGEITNGDKALAVGSGMLASGVEGIADAALLKYISNAVNKSGLDDAAKETAKEQIAEGLSDAAVRSIKQTGKSMGTEAATEMVQETISNTGAKLGWAPDREVLNEGLIEAGVVGGLTGGAITGPVSAAGNAAQAIQNRGQQEPQQNPELQEDENLEQSPEQTADQQQESIETGGTTEQQIEPDNEGTAQEQQIDQPVELNYDPEADPQTQYEQLEQERERLGQEWDQALDDGNIERREAVEQAVDQIQELKGNLIDENGSALLGTETDQEAAASEETSEDVEVEEATPEPQQAGNIEATEENQQALEDIESPTLEVEQESTEETTAADPTRVYRETSIESAEAFLPTSNTSSGYQDAGQIYVSDNPDLAIGQGNNKGVTLEFDTDLSNETPNRDKPGLEFAAGEEYALNRSPESMRDDLRRITVQSEAEVTDQGKAYRFKNFANQLVNNQGWSRTTLDNGSIVYEHPEIAETSEELQTTEQEEQAPTPEPQQQTPQEESPTPAGEQQVTPEPEQQQPQQQESQPQETPPAQAQQPSSNVGRLPLSQVQTDTNRFQNRDNAYSEDTVNSIIEDHNEGRLNPDNVPPIKVWEDPENGETYVVGGHSRLEAFKRLNLPDIQVQYLQDMSEEQAMQQGRIDNALGTAESIPEQSKIVRDWMADTEMSKTAINDRAKQLFKNNSRIVQAFAALNPTGKAVQSFQQLENNQSGDREQAQKFAKYVGEARLRHPQLTDSHEKELYDYLLSHSNQNTSTQRDFLSFVDDIVGRNTFMGQFDASQPLNIRQVKPKTDAEIQFDERIQEARQELRDSRKALQNKLSEIESRRSEGEQISEERADEVLKQYQDDVRASERNLLKVQQENKAVQRNKRDQQSMFSNAQFAGLAPRGGQGSPNQGDPSTTGADAPSARDDVVNMEESTLQGERFRQPRIDDNWVQDPQSLKEVVDNLVKTLGLTLRQGRIRMRNALGQYDRRSGVARTRMIKSIKTIAHEGGHDVMEQYGNDLKPIIRLHAAEVEPMAYDGTPEGQELDEGFAEFFRLFVLNPRYARNNAPEFFDDFSQWLDQNPELSEGLRNLQDAYETWLQQPSDKAAQSEISNTETKTQQMLSDIKERGVLGKMSEYKNKAYTAVVDQLHPLRMGVNKLMDIHEENTGERMNLETAQDFYKLARLTADAYSAGQMDIEFGVENYNTAKAEGPALRDALDNAFEGKFTQKNIDAFGSYLASKRLVHEWDRYQNGDIPNAPSKLSKEDHQLNIKKLESEHPSFAEAADQIYEWNSNLWRKKYDAGLISEDQYMNGIENHPDYVPLQRDMSDRDPGVTSSGQSGTGKQSVLNSFKGSDRNIINPLESMMEDAYETAVFVKQNDAKRALLDLARTIGNPAGEVVEEIPGSRATGFQVDPKDVLKAVQKETDWNMLGERDALTYSNAAAAIDNMDLPMVSLWKQGEINEQGEPIIYAWEDGERVALRLADGEFGVDMYEAFVNLGRENSDIVTNALAYPASWLRAGVTTDPSFFVANLARDQVAAWILTDDFTPILSSAEGLSSELNQDEYSRLYRSTSGMSTQNTAALDKTRVQQEIKDLRKKNIVVRRMTSVRGFAELTDISETSTRLGVFKRSLKNAKERGLSDKEAALEAAYQARDLIDFGRHGSKMNATRRLITFMNAAIQGLDKGGRVLNAEGNLKKAITPFIKDVNGRELSQSEQQQLNLAKKAWGKVTTIGVMGAALTAMWMDDEDYDELGKTYMRSTHWLVPNPAGGLDGVRKWIAIPKPFELAFLSNTFENAVEGIYHKDPDAFNRWLGSLYEIMAPPTRAPGVAVPTEVWANKRFFDNRPIVQERLQGLEPWKQYNSYTSDFGKWMGKQINVSPAVIDHVITGFTGSWGRTLLSMSSSSGPNDPEAGWDDTWVARRFVRSPDRGSFSENNFWEQMARNEGEIMSYYQTFRDLESTATREEAQDYFDKLEDWQKLYVSQNFLRIKDAGVRGVEDQHPLDRARKSASTISKLRSDLRDNESFNPSKKRELDDLLDRMATVEYRNALIASRHPSYREREMMNMQKVLQKIENVSPTFYENILADRYKANKLQLDPTGTYLQYSRDFNTRLNRFAVSTQTELINNENLANE